MKHLETQNEKSQINTKDLQPVDLIKINIGQEKTKPNEQLDNISDFLSKLENKSPEEIIQALLMLSIDSLQQNNKQICNRLRNKMEMSIQNGNFDNAHKYHTIMVGGGEQFLGINGYILMFSTENIEQQITQETLIYGKLLKQNYKKYIGYKYTIIEKTGDLKTIFSFYKRTIKEYDIFNNDYKEFVSGAINDMRNFQKTLNKENINLANEWNNYISELLVNNEDINRDELLQNAEILDGNTTDTTKNNLQDPELISLLPSNRQDELLTISINNNLILAEQYFGERRYAEAHEKYKVIEKSLEKISPENILKTTITTEVQNKIKQIEQILEKRGERIPENRFYQEILTFLQGEVIEGDKMEINEDSSEEAQKTIEIDVLKYKELIDRYIEAGVITKNFNNTTANTGDNTEEEKINKIIIRKNLPYSNQVVYQIGVNDGTEKETYTIKPRQKKILNSKNEEIEFSKNSIYEILNSEKIEEYEKNLKGLEAVDISVYDYLTNIKNENIEQLSIYGNGYGPKLNGITKNFLVMIEGKVGEYIDSNDNSQIILNKFLELNKFSNLKTVEFRGVKAPNTINCNLEKVYLDDCSVTDNLQYNNTKELYILRCEYNKEQATINCPNLESLTIQTNKEHKLNTPKLKTLSWNLGNIGTMDIINISNLQNLEKLAIEGIDLPKPLILDKNPKLEAIRLSGNKINKKTLSEDNCKNIKYYKFLERKINGDYVSIFPFEEKNPQTKNITIGRSEFTLFVKDNGPKETENLQKSEQPKGLEITNFEMPEYGTSLQNKPLSSSYQLSNQILFSGQEILKTDTIEFSNELKEYGYFRLETYEKILQSGVNRKSTINFQTKNDIIDTKENDQKEKLWYKAPISIGETPIPIPEGLQIKKIIIKDTDGNGITTHEAKISQNQYGEWKINTIEPYIIKIIFEQKSENTKTREVMSSDYFYEKEILSELAQNTYKKNLQELNKNEKTNLITNFLATFYYTLNSEISNIYTLAGLENKYYQKIIEGIIYNFEGQNYNVKVGDCDQVNALAVRLFNAIGIPARLVVGYRNSKDVGGIGHGWMEYHDGNTTIQKDFTPTISIKLGQKQNNTETITTDNKENTKTEKIDNTTPDKQEKNKRRKIFKKKLKKNQ